MGGEGFRLFWGLLDLLLRWWWWWVGFGLDLEIGVIWRWVICGTAGGYDILGVDRG
jgi:hypothetical protein